MDFLTEVDKLVQLIECPIFTCKSLRSATPPCLGEGAGRGLSPTGGGGEGVLQCRNKRPGMTGLGRPVQQDQDEGHQGERLKVGLADAGCLKVNDIPTGGPERPVQSCPRAPCKHTALCPSSQKLRGSLGPPAGASLCPGATSSPLCKAELAFAGSGWAGAARWSHSG